MAASAPAPTPPAPSKWAKWRKRAVILGAILALVCKSVPEDYRAICDTLALICTGGLG